MNLLHGIISLFGRRKSGQATKMRQTRETLLPTDQERITKRLAEQNWLRFFAFYCTRESFITDHGAGRCNLLPMMAMKFVLPIHDTLCSCSTSAGRIDIAATRAWFLANREYLEWSDEVSRFVPLQSD